jgi:hypothetical protein
VATGVAPRTADKFAFNSVSGLPDHQLICIAQRLSVKLGEQPDDLPLFDVKPFGKNGRKFALVLRGAGAKVCGLL